MNDELNFENQKQFIKNTVCSMNRIQAENFILSQAKIYGIEKFKEQSVKEILNITKPSEVIPDIYYEYREIVHDGILFLLSHFSIERIISLALDQLLINQDSSKPERLILFASKIPTLHKLGQIIARNRHVDKSLKNRLIQLENDVFPKTDITILLEKIEEEIKDKKVQFSVKTDNKILAQASVGVVIPFLWKENKTDITEKGVFKLLKPGVKEYLEEELNILDNLAVFFDKNRQKYTLKNFKFIETFKDIKQALKQEINLTCEQANLKKAFYFYKDKQIPKTLPFCTENITAMEHMKGSKITDISINSDKRKNCAKILFESLIWNPLFSFEEQSLFHGDPHAGNIFAFEENNDIKIVLLDWSQAGSLSENNRIQIFKLASGIIAKHDELIYEAVKELSNEKENFLYFKRIINEIMSSKEYKNSEFIKKIFIFIDQTALKGVMFQKDLMLFRKAFFTLEGLIYELDADFDMDKYTFALLENLFIEELPKRWLYLLFPHSDNFKHYKSLMSNNDLQMLGNRVFMKNFKKIISEFQSVSITYTYFINTVSGNILKNFLMLKCTNL